MNINYCSGGTATRAIDEYPLRNAVKPTSESSKFKSIV